MCTIKTVMLFVKINCTNIIIVQADTAKYEKNTIIKKTPSMNQQEHNTLPPSKYYNECSNRYLLKARVQKCAKIHHHARNILLNVSIPTV